MFKSGGTDAFIFPEQCGPQHDFASFVNAFMKAARIIKFHYATRSHTET